MNTSLAKALRLLRLLGECGGWIGVRDLARRAGCTPTSAHGLLQGLLAEGFAAYDPATRRYGLGLAVLALADRIDAGGVLAAAARPHVAALARELGETVYATAWRAGAALVVAGVEHGAPLGPRAVERPDAMASGRVLLAHLPEAELAAWLRRSGRRGLGAALAAVRADGHAELIDHAGSGMAAVAVPVRGGDGRCVLALGASLPLARAARRRLDDLRRRLHDAAQALAAELR